MESKGVGVRTNAMDDSFLYLKAGRSLNRGFGRSKDTWKRYRDTLGTMQHNAGGTYASSPPSRNDVNSPATPLDSYLTVFLCDEGCVNG